ncbi:hypothetical protein [Dactylosporangium sp. CA-233914]|uniref:hypothetical protein n=1 Tax=Dactylosporangium sp. CA-233914 TaxID=3239934 RepID=UPI003D92DE2C
MVDRWLSGRDGVNVRGAAVVSATIDFRRAGYLGPIPRKWIKEACVAYLERRDARRLSNVDFRAALEWATQRVHGASSCITNADDDRYIAFDYLVDYVQSKWSHDSEGHDDESQPIFFADLATIPEEIWHTLADNVTSDDPQFLSCISAASVSAHPGIELRFNHALRSGEVNADQFNNSNQLLALARMCLRLSVCITCEVLVLGLDLKVLIDTLFETLRPLLKSPRVQPGANEIDAIVILDALANDNTLNAVDSPIFEATSHIEQGDLAGLAQLLRQYDLTDTAELWERRAENRATPQPEPVSRVDHDLSGRRVLWVKSKH